VDKTVRLLPKSTTVLPVDIINKLFNWYFDFAGGLAPIHVSFLLRALLVFGLPTLFCAWALASGNRTILFQALCVVLGLLLAATIPVDKLVINGRQARGWILLCGVVLLAFLPGMLVALALPTVGMQRKARIFAYVILAVLFLTNVFLAGRQ
jgi:predicted membrane-bound spermidine synthase